MIQKPWIFFFFPTPILIDKNKWFKRHEISIHSHKHELFLVGFPQLFHYFADVFFFCRPDIFDFDHLIKYEMFLQNKEEKINLTTKRWRNFLKILSPLSQITHTHASLGITKKFNFHFDLIHHNHIDAIIRFKNPDMMMAMAIENELNVYELGKNCSFIPWPDNEEKKKN